jgi:hypothetical protein
MVSRQNAFTTSQAEPLAELSEILQRRSALRIRRDRSWDARRCRATYDLPPQLIETIHTITQQLTEAHPEVNVRVSDVARLLLELGVQAYEQEEVSADWLPRRGTLLAFRR